MTCGELTVKVVYWPELPNLYYLDRHGVRYINSAFDAEKKVSLDVQ